MPDANDGDVISATHPFVGERVEPSPSDVREGTLIADRYRIEEVVGAGGMGVVYRAHDGRLGRDVAVKLMLEESAVGQRWMMREASAMAQLSHPNVVAAYDVGMWRERVFLAMELISGRTVRAWLDERPRAWREVLEIFLAAGEGLQAIHEAGLVHRDVKPANILIDDRGRVRVADLGLARVEPGARAPRGEDARGARSPALPPALEPTRTRGIVGTPAYMAPEQQEGAGDARSDQYSFCVTLHEALHGFRPGTPGARRGGVPRWLDEVMARGLARDAARRYASMRELLAALRRPARPGARLGIAAAVGVVAVAGGVVALVARQDPPTHAAPAAPAIVPPLAPVEVGATRALTAEGGCAYAPVFADDHTVVFDRTLRGRTDLHALDLRGGGVRVVSDAPTMEWRTGRGSRDGEVIFSSTDESLGLDGTRLQLLDLASLVRTPLATASTSASHGGGWLYYLTMDVSAVRRARAGVDELVARPPVGQTDAIMASRDGRWVAVHADFRSPRVCLVDATSQTTSCLDAPRALIGRGDFSPRSNALYYAAADGVHRVDVASRADTLAIEGAGAPGGLTIAPDGKTLVYSSCRPRASLVEAATGRVRIEERTGDPVVAGDGSIAFVRRPGGALVVKDPRGMTRVLTDPDLGRIERPDFDDTGRRLVFEASGPRPGIHIANAAGSLELVQVTSGPSDTYPLWLPDGRIVFTRTDEQGQGVILAVEAGGGEPRRVHPGARATRARLRSSGEVVLMGSAAADVEGERIYLWDPSTGRERQLRIPAIAGTYILRLRASLDGRWLVVNTGTLGQEVWKVPVAAPARAEKIFTLEQGSTMDGLTFDEQGNVLVVPETWIGELFAVTGRFE